MFLTKHCFEKYNKLDRSPFSQKGYEEPKLHHLCQIALVNYVLRKLEAKYFFKKYLKKLDRKEVSSIVQQCNI